MARQFDTIGITGKPRDRVVADTIERIAHRIVDLGREVLLDAETLGRRRSAHRAVSRDELIRCCQLMIAVGGDGTLLNTARLLVERDVPILGVNRGRLGFLVDVSPSKLEDIDQVLQGEFIEDSRMLLEAQVRDGERVISRGIALNDVVLHKWNTARMIEFETRINGELLHRHRSDGLIICTPTGSTAYAMASGGPIIHPDVDAMGLVAISPHTLSNRPLVISADDVLELHVNEDDYESVRVSCDGQSDLGLVSGGRIVIRRHPRRVCIVHPSRYRYSEILRAKLGWGDTNLA